MLCGPSQELPWFDEAVALFLWGTNTSLELPMKRLS